MGSHHGGPVNDSAGTGHYADHYDDQRKDPDTVKGETNDQNAAEDHYSDHTNLTEKLAEYIHRHNSTLDEQCNPLAKCYNHPRENFLDADLFAHRFLHQSSASLSQRVQTPVEKNTDQLSFSLTAKRQLDRNLNVPEEGPSGPSQVHLPRAFGHSASSSIRSTPVVPEQQIPNTIHGNGPTSRRPISPFFPNYASTEYADVKHFPLGQTPRQHASPFDTRGMKITRDNPQTPRSEGRSGIPFGSEMQNHCHLPTPPNRGRYQRSATSTPLPSFHDPQTGIASLPTYSALRHTPPNIQNTTISAPLSIPSEPLPPQQPNATTQNRTLIQNNHSQPPNHPSPSTRSETKTLPPRTFRHNWAAAHAHRSLTYTPPYLAPHTDPTITQIFSNPEPWVDELYAAIHNTSSVKDSPGSLALKPFLPLSPLYSSALIEATSISILTALHERCILGFRGPRHMNKSLKPSRNLEEDRTANCRERLENVIRVLRWNKRVCRDVLYEDLKVRLLVNAPLGVDKEKDSQKGSNDQRRARQVRERAAARVAVEVLGMGVEEVGVKRGRYEDEGNRNDGGRSLKRMKR
ncbi:hypothetical protein GQ43DRAFT_428038 [Delitschia confertaspora ATCC 74209]|uniref:Uncharacterized protein n=1 Tax=Delitschia confertaspora ATCC 74209 TaxID=1513339 RepID=A0A9P4JUP0_9PLEO|nr:hypothetical protein GQ43DRAFT_428038 [Delitschia confertaspora ATCC 74209]